MTNKYYDTTSLTMLQINYLVNKLSNNAGIKPKTTMFFAHKVRSCPFIYIADGIVTFTSCPDGEIMDLPDCIKHRTKEIVTDWINERGWSVEKAFGKTSGIISYLLEDEGWLWDDYKHIIGEDPVYAAIALYMDMQYLSWNEMKRVI